VEDKFSSQLNKRRGKKCKKSMKIKTIARYDR